MGKTFESLPGNWSGKVGDRGRCQRRSDIHGQCIGPYSFGWAVQGFLDEKEGLPLSLHVEPASEPDTRTGHSPTQITGVLTVEGLTADKDSFVYQDPKTFSSASATYYRCVKTSNAG